MSVGHTTRCMPQKQIFDAGELLVAAEQSGGCLAEQLHWLFDFGHSGEPVECDLHIVDLAELAIFIESLDFQGAAASGWSGRTPGLWPVPDATAESLSRAGT